MDNMKKMADYEIAVERRLEKSCERDGWIASAHVAFGGDYVDCQLEKFGREEVRDESAATSNAVEASMTISCSCSTTSCTVVTLTCRTGQVDIPLRMSCWQTK